MPGPTAWQQSVNVTNTGTQSITTTTETVIATLTNLSSRSIGAPVSLNGYAQFAVNASTTATVLRIRIGSVTGALVGVNPGQFSGTAGSVTNDQLSVQGVDTPAGEYGSQTYVLTIQATAAAANWNTLYASLTALQ